MLRRSLIGAGAVVALLSVPAGALAAPPGPRPTDQGSDADIRYRVAEATPYDAPGGTVRVHYVARGADAPALTDIQNAAGAPGAAGVPDYVEAVGAEVEKALAFEVGVLGFRPPARDDGDGVERGGDGRFDVYVVSFEAHHQQGVLGITVTDAPDSPSSAFLEVDSQ